MPNSVPVKKYKAPKYDRAKIRKAEAKMMAKWDAAIAEAVEWLETIDISETPERNADGDCGPEFGTVYGLISGLRDTLGSVRDLLPEEN